MNKSCGDPNFRKLRNLLGGIGVVALATVAAPVHAAPINFGLGGTGTADGTFTYNATTNTFTAWNITVSAGTGSSSSTFSPVVYSNTVAGSVGGPGGFNGASFYDFSFFSPTGGNPGGRTLFFVVPGVADTSIAGLPSAPGQITQIALVTNDSASAAAAGCLGLQSPGAIPCSAEGQNVGQRNLIQPAFFTITEGLNGLFTFALTSTPLAPVGAPEPSSVQILALGLLGLLVIGTLRHVSPRRSQPS